MDFNLIYKVSSISCFSFIWYRVKAELWKTQKNRKETLYLIKKKRHWERGDQSCLKHFMFDEWIDRGDLIVWIMSLFCIWGTLLCKPLGVVSKSDLWNRHCYSDKVKQKIGEALVVFSWIGGLGVWWLAHSLPTSRAFFL